MSSLELPNIVFPVEKFSSITFVTKVFAVTEPSKTMSPSTLILEAEIIEPLAVLNIISSIFAEEPVIIAFS